MAARDFFIFAYYLLVVDFVGFWRAIYFHFI